VGGVADEGLAAALTSGVRTASGETLRAKHARVLRMGERNTWLELVLDEGKNRQIRSMLDHLGITVLRLVRIAVGPLQLGVLPKGKYRSLSPNEKAAMDQAIKASSSGITLRQ
jgi:23S rRNA pseudouridine2605 synthase